MLLPPRFSIALVIEPDTSTSRPTSKGGDLRLTHAYFTSRVSHLLILLRQ